MNKEITIEILEKIVNEYIKYNGAIKDLFTENEKIIIKENYLNYLKSKITTGEKMTKELMLTNTTWDTYSLNITFIYIFDLISLSESELITKIKNSLKESIMSSPNERKNPKNTIQQINEIGKNIKIEDYIAINQKISQIDTKQLSDKIQKSKIIENKIEKPIYKIILF